MVHPSVASQHLIYVHYVMVYVNSCICVVPASHEV